VSCAFATNVRPGTLTDDAKKRVTAMPPVPNIPSPLKAAAQWAHVGTTAVAMLGPATVVAPLSRRAGLELFRRWAKLQLDRFGIEIAVDDRSGYDGRRAVLFVDLHQQTLLSSLIYPQVIAQMASLVVNVEFLALTLVGWLSYAMGSVPIVRQNPKQAKAALARVVERLKAGESFGISIEGKRSEDGGLSPYKKGPAVLAIQAQCDIVPFMTFGEYELWPRGEWRIRPGRIEAVAFPAISTKGLTYADRDALVDRLWRLANEERAKRGYGSGTVGTSPLAERTRNRSASR